MGVNRQSNSSKLPSDPMELQLQLQPCFNQQTVQWELHIQLKCANAVDKDTVE